MYIKTEGATAEVTNWNPRTEKHGEERVMAGDVDIRVDQPVEILEQIVVDKADFRKLLYKNNGELRALCLKPLQFHREFKAMELIFFDEDVNIVLKVYAKKVKGLVAEIEAGYRVKLKFQAQVEVNEDESGELHGMSVMSGVAIELKAGGGQADLEEAAA